MDWTKTAREIDCLVRGATPWPGAFTTTADGAIKIFSVKPLHTGPSGRARRDHRRRREEGVGCFLRG